MFLIYRAKGIAKCDEVDIVIPAICVEDEVKRSIGGTARSKRQSDFSMEFLSIPLEVERYHDRRQSSYWRGLFYLWFMELLHDPRLGRNDR